MSQCIPSALAGVLAALHPPPVIHSPSPLPCRMQVMTKIGAVCLVTIGVWVVILLGVQFG